MLPSVLALQPSYLLTVRPLQTEIFLPSYLDCEYVPLENRQEPVHEIRLSDEELKQMLPQ